MQVRFCCNITINGSPNQFDLVRFAEIVEKVLYLFRPKRKKQKHQRNYYSNNHFLHFATFANSLLLVSAVMLCRYESLS